jgi:hypothetical protein
MAINFREIPGFVQEGRRQDVCSKASCVIEVITQIAVRVLFIAANILMAAAAFPVTFHGVMIPIVAIGATTLSGFFFPDALAVRRPVFGALPPLIRPVRMLAQGGLPIGYPENCPRGYMREGQNCALNSSAHILDSIPLIAAWLRNPITQQTDLPTFLNVLAGYDAKPDLLAQFNAFVNAQPQPRLPVVTMFRDFMSEYQPPQNQAVDFRRIKRVFEDLLILQKPFSEFFKANDDAIRAHQMVSAGNSQNLRIALSQVSAIIDPSSHVQIDAAEALRLVLDVLPDHFKTRIETTRLMNEAGLPPIAEPPPPKEERVPFLTLALDPSHPHKGLQELLEDHCNNTNNEPARYKGNDGAMHEYPVESEIVKFIDPPPFLFLHLKRFSSEKPPISWWSRFLPSLFPPLQWRAVKIDTPVINPERISVTLKNGRVCQYELKSFLNHLGKDGSGHYTSSQILNGNKFRMNDTQVSMVDPAHPEQWDEDLRHAYFLCYLPVENQAPVR